MRDTSSDNHMKVEVCWGVQTSLFSGLSTSVVFDAYVYFNLSQTSIVWKLCSYTSVHSFPCHYARGKIATFTPAALSQW
jgi:hypothetical protein